jgi:nitroreductase
MTAESTIDLTPAELLTTTRSVRRRLDLSRPVPRELIETCLTIAIQAPSGSNLQGWQFLVIDDSARKAALASYYARSHAQYRPVTTRPAPGESSQAPVRMRASVDFLAEHLHEVPTLLMPLQRGRLPSEATNHQAAGFYGSILPAVWSFMLAARLQGLGTSFTTMHLRYEREVAAEFAIPYDKATQIGLVAVGYYRGEQFSPAARHPVSGLIHWNSW